MKMTIMQHLMELRKRLLWTALFFACSFGVGWFLAPYLQSYLVQPLISVWANAQMIYTGLVDGLTIQFSLATLIAIVITLPFAVFQIWLFVAPGLKENEKKLIIPVLILSPILFILGAAFAFYILFPMAFAFFVSLNKSAMAPVLLLPSMTDYMVLVLGLLKIFGIAFQLPLVLFVLNKVGVLPRSVIVKSRRYAIVGFFILGAIFTPPDVASQVLFALPMIALFELSLLFMKKE